MALTAIHLAVLTVEFVIQRQFSQRLRIPSLQLQTISRLAVVEMLVSWRMFGWEMPFRIARFPDTPWRNAGGAGVVLIHGLFCNRAVWNPWMSRLRAHGVPFIALTLEPPFASIDDYRAVIDTAVHTMHEATGHPCILVGHSMGGLAARAWAAASNDHSLVHRIVTIGSPHAGTWLSRFSSRANARQMALGSGWLANLAASERPECTSRFTCFHSESDNVIVPWTSARRDGADNRRIVGQPHLALLRVPEIFEETLRLVSVASQARNDG